MTPRRAARSALMAALLVAVAAGCGGDDAAAGVASLEGATTSSSPEAGSPIGGGVDLEEALLAFTACMREEGVDLPDPEFDAQGNLKLVSFMADAGTVVSAAGGMEALREAAGTCRHHLDGVALQFASIDRTEMEDRMLDYARCMRDNGFDLPDPDFSGGLRMRGPFPGMSPDVLSDPDFREANEQCQGLFAGLLPEVGGDQEGG